MGDVRELRALGGGEISIEFLEICVKGRTVHVSFAVAVCVWVVSAGPRVDSAWVGGDLSAVHWCLSDQAKARLVNAGCIVQLDYQTTLQYGSPH